MHSFVTFVFAFSLANIVAAVPLSHGHSHRKFHVAHKAHDKYPEHHHVEASKPTSPNIDHEKGTCGGNTGYVCAPDFCCSPWGYCGQTDAYCGVGNGTAPQPTSLPVIPQSTFPVFPSPVIPQSTTFSQSWPHSTTAPAPTTYPSPVIPTTHSLEPTPVPTSIPSAFSSPVASASATPSVSKSGLGDKYSMYSGDGSAGAGWPATSEWASFDSMWSANEADMLESCSQFNVPNNSAQEQLYLQSAIQTVGGAAGIDPRFIFAIVLQESAGCVRAPTTSYSVTNPGLMQSHDGSGSCNNGGSVQTPCPASEITQMIQDGVDGTSSGDGLKQCFAEAPAASGAEKYYQAARIYNSGSIAPGGNLDAGDATQCYAADIANRLTGWVNAPTTCNL